MPSGLFWESMSCWPSAYPPPGTAMWSAKNLPSFFELWGRYQPKTGRQLPCRWDFEWAGWREASRRWGWGGWGWSWSVSILQEAAWERKWRTGWKLTWLDRCWVQGRIRRCRWCRAWRRICWSWWYWEASCTACNRTDPANWAPSDHGK